MTPRRRKKHALLARDLRRPNQTPDPNNPSGSDEPFLPVVGDLYQVLPLIYSSTDPAAERPVVVVAVSSGSFGRVQFMTRTTDLSVDGVQHPADDDLDLNEDGCFSELHSCSSTLWKAGNVRYLGRLDEQYLNPILEAL